MLQRCWRACSRALRCLVASKKTQYVAISYMCSFSADCSTSFHARVSRIMPPEKSESSLALIFPPMMPPLWCLSLIHISEPTRLGMISYAVFCLKKKMRSRCSGSATSFSGSTSAEAATTVALEAELNSPYRVLKYTKQTS